MDDAQLQNEVLELTLALLDGDATTEERARLERLLADNPSAISWYLRIVDDTLTLRDASAARRNESLDGTEHRAQAEPAAPGHPLASLSRFAGARWSHTWTVLAAVACLLLVAATILGLANLRPPSGHRGPNPGEAFARIVDVSNVTWADDAQPYAEWSVLKPGDVLKFESGWVNLFLANGAELLIEGPADVEFVSLQNVFARQGKLAARVGPGAVGFRVDTPHAQVTDRGTAFGISVDGDSHTSVVVYEGKVDLDVLGDGAPPRRRLESGEALSVNRQGQLSRITTVQSADFLEPPQVRVDGPSEGHVITSVTDNVRSLATAKFYRVIPRGFREDCRAYVDRLHEWNGVDAGKLPAFLTGGDYVMTFNDDKITTEIQIAVGVSRPANVYVLIDDRVPPPAWVQRDFVDTGWDVGCDEGWEDKIIDTGIGAGNSIDHVFSVWQRVVPEPTTVMLGPLTHEKSPPPASAVLRSMYGIVVVPMRGGLGGPGKADFDERR